MDKLSSFFFIQRKEDGLPDIFRRVRLMPLYSFPHFKDFNLKITELKNRFFIHLDFDAFFAQVEQRDNPNLRGRPVSVGSTTGEKGIVMTASYEARAFGIETGMSAWEAKRICPQLISVPCYGPKYESVTQSLMRGLKTFVPDDCIEQYSVDEVFVDITPIVKNFDQAREVGEKIKQKVRDLEDLTCSIGLSYNKSYAKMATKFQKPDGLSVVTQQDRESVIYPMRTKKLWGIGHRIERRLGALNILTLGDLAKANPAALRKEFGINGIVFQKMARGEDTSGIFKKTAKEKCLNHHHTMQHNIYTEEDIKKEIRRVGEYVCRKLRDKELVAGHLYLVIRYDNLKYAGYDARLKQPTNDDREIFETALRLFRRFPRPSEKHKARMFGMTVFDLHADPRRENLELFDKKINFPYREMDKLKYKYGESIIRLGLAV
ncbi:MAG: DNA polymerase IV [Ignavibacteriae bacterium]|nr:DNA polymerase IV [Ignavibacteriota bacterium]